MKHPFIRMLLLLAGVLLLAIGAAILFQPHAFFAANEVTLGNQPNLLSEVRAPGGLLIGSAIVILLGAFRQNITLHALMLAAMVYGLYGISRVASIVLDGLPAASLIGAMVVEVIIGALCLFSIRYLNTSQ